MQSAHSIKPKSNHFAKIFSVASLIVCLTKQWCNYSSAARGHCLLNSGCFAEITTTHLSHHFIPREEKSVKEQKKYIARLCLQLAEKSSKKIFLIFTNALHISSNVRKYNIGNSGFWFCGVLFVCLKLSFLNNRKTS